MTSHETPLSNFQDLPLWPGILLSQKKHSEQKGSLSGINIFFNMHSKLCWTKCWQHLDRTFNMLLGPTTQGWYSFELLKFHDFPGFPWPVRTLLLQLLCFFWATLVCSFKRLNWFAISKLNNYILITEQWLSSKSNLMLS